MELHLSHENKEIQQLYQEFYDTPLSDMAEAMLHTAYQDRSADLTKGAKKKMMKWKCLICGYIYEARSCQLILSAQSVSRVQISL